MPTKNLTITEAAKILRLHRATVYKMFENAEILGFKVRGRIRIPLDALEDFQNGLISQHYKDVLGLENFSEDSEKKN